MIVPKYTCQYFPEVKEGQRKKNSKKWLTGKSSFSFTWFVHNSQSFNKCFPIYSKTHWSCSFSQAPNIYMGVFLLVVTFLYWFFVCVLFGILLACFVFKIRCSASYFACKFMLLPRMQVSLRIGYYLHYRNANPLTNLFKTSLSFWLPWFQGNTWPFTENTKLSHFITQFRICLTWKQMKVWTLLPPSHSMFTLSKCLPHSESLLAHFFPCSRCSKHLLSQLRENQTN